MSKHGSRKKETKKERKKETKGFTYNFAIFTLLLRLLSGNGGRNVGELGRAHGTGLPLFVDGVLGGDAFGGMLLGSHGHRSRKGFNCVGT